MRRLLWTGVVAAVAGLSSAVALAGNQEVADQIAANLKKSGQMDHYKIGVRFLDGTAWLQGHVRDQEQMQRALQTAFQTPGVQRVVNDMTIGEATAPAADTGFMAKLNSKLSALNPLRKDESSDSEVNSAQPVASSFSASRGAIATAAMQPIPSPPPAPMPAPAMNGAKPATLPQSPEAAAGVPGAPLPMYPQGVGGSPAPMRTDQPCMPNYAWPSYASYPNYAAVTYPKQYSPTAWPYIGPFYPYPQVPLGWRKVTLEWSDGWWFLDFKDEPRCCWWR